LMIVSLVGVTTLAQGVNVCPAGNVKYEIGGGYEYNDGSGWVEASEDRACWGANEGYGVTGVCIYVGGPDNEERLINLGPGDGCWDNPEKYGISHVVLYTEAILEPTPTDTPVEPTPTIVEPTPTEVPPEPTPTDTPPEPKRDGSTNSQWSSFDWWSTRAKPTIIVDGCYFGWRGFSCLFCFASSQDLRKKSNCLLEKEVIIISYKPHPARGS